MDEVDKIIIHSLRQIGCNIEDAPSMANFTPEMLVLAVSTCLQEIKPNAVLPRTLPPGMAQRFTVASALAEACASCNYRGDIGYQTFLYPNAVDVRRLLMFLIEQLPKDNRITTDTLSQGPIGELALLQKQISERISQQLNTLWVPQYCRAVANRRHMGCSSQNIRFSPQPNLNIPGVNECAKEVKSYFQQQAPNVFQQTAAEEFDLIGSILHKNAMDLYSAGESLESVKYSVGSLANATNVNISLETTIKTDAASDLPITENSKTPLELLSDHVNNLKHQNDKLLVERKELSMRLSTLKAEQSALHAKLEEIRKDVKLHERTCVVLEAPKENLSKLESLITSALERRNTMEQQWHSYREPMVEKLIALQTAKQAKNIHNVTDLRAIISQLEQTLVEKTSHHSQLSVQLKNASDSVASRKEYTHRILEFIGNIRKQRNDIFKVLDDTRDLQKQLNSVSAQLQRQFNYTDDLLFQSAKHDLHAKKAYKLLASLHTTCNDLVDLVSKTGNVTKEIRDLEVQIDREKLKNVAMSLEQISADIRNFENVIKSIQAEISKVENKITIA